MQRHRDLAGAPVRTASQTWAVLTQLVVDTATRSPHITAEDVTAAATAAAPAGRMLVAAGHLERHPVVFIADDLELYITAVTADKAFDVEENLAPVPGAAQAREWTLHLPTPDPIGACVADLIASVPHLSSEPPSATARADDAARARTATRTAMQTTGQATTSMLNLAALAERRGYR
jgi:hypothetical protein